MKRRTLKKKLLAEQEKNAKLLDMINHIHSIHSRASVPVIEGVECRIETIRTVCKMDISQYHRIDDEHLRKLVVDDFLHSSQCKDILSNAIIGHAEVDYNTGDMVIKSKMFVAFPRVVSCIKDDSIFAHENNIHN